MFYDFVVIVSSPSEVRRLKTFSHFDFISSLSTSHHKKTIKIEHPHLKEDNTTIVPTDLIFNKPNNNNNTSNNNNGTFPNQNGGTNFLHNGEKKDGKILKQNGSTLKQNGSRKISHSSKPKQQKTKQNADVSIDLIGKEQTLTDSQYTVWI